MSSLDWLAVWQRKGSEETTDLVRLDGFEHTTIEPAAVAAGIGAALELRPEDSVLEVGCGAGMLARLLRCRYVGVDYSPAMVDRFSTLHPLPALVGAADELPFRDHCFDKVFAFSVFQYFPDPDYAARALGEMCRVARRAVFVGDLPVRSHSAHHQLYRREQFDGWTITAGFYNPDRFNALRWC